MRRFDKPARTVYLLLRLFVDAACLALDIFVGDHRGANLLVAVGGELLLKRGGSVDLRVLRGTHFELVVNEQVDIFVNGFLVNHAVGIVLVVRIFKFGTRHIFAGNPHYHGVLRGLRERARRNKGGCGTDNELFHRVGIMLSC